MGLFNWEELENEEVAKKVKNDGDKNVEKDEISDIDMLKGLHEKVDSLHAKIDEMRAKGTTSTTAFEKEKESLAETEHEEKEETGTTQADEASQTTEETE